MRRGTMLRVVLLGVLLLVVGLLILLFARLSSLRSGISTGLADWQPWEQVAGR